MFAQLKFGKKDENILIDYLCPLTEQKAGIWSHKNCLLYIIQGNKGFEAADHYYKSMPGQLLFIRKGGFIVHQFFQQPYRALIFMFDDSALHEFLSEYPNLVSSTVSDANDIVTMPVVMEIKTSPFIDSTFSSSLEYLKHPTAESKIALELKFRELLVNLLREKHSNLFYSYLYFLCKDERLSFIKLMNDNGHYHLTIEELARTAHMSASTFKRVFKKYMDASPGSWLRQKRMERAKAMLGKGATVSAIAFELGYNDTAAFSKAFKMATDRYPTDFVKKEVV
jgi:AraC-like DNA-binding protein